MGDTLDGFDDFFKYAVFQLLAACPGSVVSGSRTTDEQAALRAAKGPWSKNNPGAAEPGTSNHEVGVGHGAADLDGDLKCMHKLAPSLGLVFPIGNEPWHVEPSDELIAQGMEFFGLEEGAAAEDLMVPAEEEDQGLAGIRSIIFGEGGPENPLGDIPSRVAAAFAPEAKPKAAAAEEAAFAPEASAGFTAGEGGAMSAVDVAKVYAEAGFTGEALVTMVAIARGESGWDPTADGDTSITDSTWGPSMGLSQIRSLNAERGTGGWRDATRLHDPKFNAKAAYAISNGGTNFGPWTVFSKGIYQQYTDEARAAVSALGSGAYRPSAAPVASVEPEPDPGLDPTEGVLDPVGWSSEIAELVLGSARAGGDVLAEAGLKRKEKDEEDEAVEFSL